MAMLVICPHCKPVDESKTGRPARPQAIGVGIPRRHFIKHMQLVHNLEPKG
jgi:hypothetical protein